MTVLIAEDYWLLADLIRQAVTDAGGKVVGPTPSLSEAERLAATASFDTVVMDLNLRGGHADALALRLAREGRKVIVLTGYEPRPELATEVHRCLSKPVSTQDLIAALASP
jgi:DNA-binding NarL/FixJ family response regulator